MKKERIAIPLDKIQLNKGQIEWLPKNPRLWKDDSLERMIRSLDEDPDFMEDRPPLVVPLPGGKGDFVVFGGNERVEGEKRRKAVKALECYVYIPENEDDRQTVKRRAMKDNGSFGAWDFDELANSWDDLPLADFGIPVWDNAENGIQAGGGASNSGRIEGKDDDYDVDQKVENRVKRGEIWSLGPHRLMCGDSTKPEDIAKLMDGEAADLWLTDPPYNVDYEEKEQYKIDLGYAVSKHDVAIANDKMSNNDFLKFLTDAFAAAKQFLRPGCVFYIWHSDTEGYNFRKALLDIKNMKVAETLIWAKDRLCFGRQDYHWQHEPCLYGWKEGAGHSWYSDRSQTTVMNFQKPQKSELHPTMKPVELFAYLMQNSSQAGDIVLDTFGGSGTTIVAAEQLGRKARLMELEPHYCDVIIARWEALTGEKAVKL